MAGHPDEIRRETGTAQGDATLENAEYGVFKDGQLVGQLFYRAERQLHHGLVRLRR